MKKILLLPIFLAFLIFNFFRQRRISLPPLARLAFGGWLTFFIFLFPLFTHHPSLLTPALAQDTGWTIESFSSNILIKKDGRVNVTETIEVDFASLQKHGIFREIPLEGLRFKLIWVKQDGKEAKTKVSKDAGRVNIRIGDPDRTLSGKVSYEIAYEVGFAIGRFEDHDELYWDVTGDEWPVPILSTDATVTLEEGNLKRLNCFTGPSGSQEKNCDGLLYGTYATFQAFGELAAGEGFTIAVSFPKGLIEDPTYWEDILAVVWAIFGSLGAMGAVLWLWKTRGRDMWYRKNVILNPEASDEIKPLFAKQTIIPEFDPPDHKSLGAAGTGKLKPAEVGTIIDERVDIQDISATIVDLAVRGYLKIHEIKEGRKTVYMFEKLKDFESPEVSLDLDPYEKKILEGLFEGLPASGVDKWVALGSLKEKFYTHLSKIRDDLYTQMVSEGYFPKRPDHVKGLYMGAGGAILLIGLILLTITEGALLLPFVPFGTLGVLLLIFGPSMARKTAKGSEAVRRISGFKLFIDTAQKYPQQFNERMNIFDQLLPYAMVFGAVDKWVKTFQVLGLEPKEPSWYAGSTAFNALSFGSSMNSFGSSLASTLPSAPGGGGSGFGGGGGAGGGGGGGGGGSW